MFRKKSKRGFTLIELLVVIAIIGILSSVVLASLSGARESARDAMRQQDIRQINTAVQMYINDNGQPPFDGNDTWYQTTHSNWSSLASELQPYIDPLPIDPIDTNTPDPLFYTYRAGGSSTGYGCGYDPGEDSYMFIVRFESSDPDGYAVRNASEHEYCLIQ